MTMTIDHPIPPMTNPLGRHWDQPDRSEILIDDKCAVMSEATFRKLARYDCTYPSGVYEGKMWARCQVGRVYLCWYGPSGEPKCCSINHREVLFV